MYRPNWDAWSNWEYLADGYLFAAEIAAQRILEEDHSRRLALQRQTGDANPGGVLINAVVFNYRHYLELRLKALAMMVAAYQGLPVTHINGHALRDPWRPVKPFFDAFGDRRAERLDTCIQQFDDLDLGSTTFRYPVDRGGTSTQVPKAELRTVDIRYLVGVMRAIKHELDGLAQGLQDTLDARPDSDDGE